MVRRKKAAQRKRIGRVSYYFHHGAWYIYYRDGKRVIRQRVAETKEAAEQIAAQVNAQLTSSCQTLFSFTPITFSELRQAFLNHHEFVQNSSPATVNRYRAATQHLENFFCECGSSIQAHQLNGGQFVTWLRKLQVSPNGHPNTAKRTLRDKGLRYILEVCRSLYAYAAKHRNLPPYSDNPFSIINIERMTIEDAKPIFIFDAETELQFLQQADDWTFPVQFTLAKTGLRSGELVHLLIEDIDLENGWLHVRNKPELCWNVKTRRERSVPLIEELAEVLRVVIGTRSSGPVFIRHKFDPQQSPLGNQDRTALTEAFQQRIKIASSESGTSLSRVNQSKLASTVWRDAGAIRADRIRTTFMRTANAINILTASCPKSWRHTFATLLQDANVDPLIRQITLGHKPTDDARGGLGMTGIYTHTRAETQKREIERALRLWSRSLEYAQRWVSASNKTEI